MPVPSSSARDTLAIDWAFFGELCRALAIHVHREYDPDLVIGIAKAGVIPAAIIASMLDRPFAAIVISRDEAGADPRLLSQELPPVTGRRVLIVDETCDSGDTMRLALHAVRGGQPAEVRTAVSFRTGAWEPDFQAFATEKKIILPWDGEVLHTG